MLNTVGIKSRTAVTTDSFGQPELRMWLWETAYISKMQRLYETPCAR